MGRDKVLGLSLAILLIGFAGAFCFRNEPFVENGLKLARAKILDDAIAERPGPKPYAAAADSKIEPAKRPLPTVTLGGIEAVEPFADLQTAQADAQKKTTDRSIRNRSGPPTSASRPQRPTRGAAETEPASLSPAIEADPSSSDSPSPEVTMPTINPAAPLPSRVNESTPPSASPEPPVSSGPPASSEPAVSSDRGSSFPEPTVTPGSPAGTSTGDEAQTKSNEIIIQPNRPADRLASSTEPGNGWQSPADPRDRDPAAEKKPDNQPAETNNTGTGRPSIHDMSSIDQRPRTKLVAETHLAGEDAKDEERRRSGGEAGGPAGEGDRRDISTVGEAPRDNTTTSPPVNTLDDASKTISHRVRRGDTLTKISLHYLGDAGRYREIFEANRDQLHGPNDRLKIGMTLRIPRNAKKSDALKGPVAKRRLHPYRIGSGIAAARSRSAPIHNVGRRKITAPKIDVNKPSPRPPASDDESVNPPAPSAIRFVPVRRAPFLPGNAQSNPATGEETGERQGKKSWLSQRPPDEGATDAPQSDRPSADGNEPAERTETEKKSPVEQKSEMSPDLSHYRYYPKRDGETLKLAGDRDDVILR